MNDKLIRSVVLGISAMIGFAITETVYTMTVNVLRKEQEKNVIEMVEAPEELES